MQIIDPILDTWENDFLNLIVPKKCDPILVTLVKMPETATPIIVSPVVKMRSHPAAHPPVAYTRNPPPGGVAAYVEYSWDYPIAAVVCHHVTQCSYYFGILKFHDFPWPFPWLFKVFHDLHLTIFLEIFKKWSTRRLLFDNFLFSKKALPKLYILCNQYNFPWLSITHA